MDTDEQYDSLDKLFWGDDPEPLSREAPEETFSEGMSFEEWSWREMDKQLDEHRKKQGLRKFGEKRREENLKKYLESRRNNDL